VRIRTNWHLFRRAGLDWYADSAPRLSASLAFYTFFSLAPLLTITVALAGVVFGRAAVESRVFDQIEKFVGTDTALAVQTLVHGAWQPGKDPWAMGLGFLTLFAGAAGVINELHRALNDIWGVKSPASAGIFLLSQTKLLGFFLGICFLLVVSLVVGAGIAALGRLYGAWLPWPLELLRLLDVVFEWMMTLFIFAAIFKWVPHARIAWRDVWTGAAFTALLFLGGKSVLSLYLRNGGVSAVYGAAGSLIVILTWIYYSALIFYFGAEFTKVHANAFGSRVEGRKA
jgi:membrane protein